MSIPLTIPLHSIFSIESIEICPKCTCQTSRDALTVIECATLAESGLPITVMYAFSVAMAVTGSLYRPSLSSTMAINFLDELYIWQALLTKCAWAPMEVSWGMDRRVCVILGQYRTLWMIMGWEDSRVTLIWLIPGARIECLSPRMILCRGWRGQ